MKKVSLLDIGGRLVGSGGDFSVSGEVLRRFRSSDDDPAQMTSDIAQDSWRAVVIFEYSVSEKVYLTTVVGKDFDEGQKGRNLVSTVGLKVGLGERRLSID